MLKVPLSEALVVPFPAAIGVVVIGSVIVDVPLGDRVGVLVTILELS